MQQFKYSILLIILLLAESESVKFFTEKKIVASDRVSVIHWKLTLNSKADFEYAIITHTTFKKTSLLQSDTNIFKEAWRFYDDTLFLYNNACPKVIKYIKKGKYLNSLGACIDSFGEKQIYKLKQMK